MANGSQMKHLIQQANEEVAEKGMAAGQDVIMLAGFAYMVEELRKAQQFRLGPVVFSGGTGVGIGAALTVLKVFGL